MKKTAKRPVKKSKKTVKKDAAPVPKKLTLMDRLPKNEIERMELMIRMTEKHINPHSVNCAMKAQAERLKLQLEEMKKNSPQS